MELVQVIGRRGGGGEGEGEGANEAPDRKCGVLRSGLSKIFFPRQFLFLKSQRQAISSTQAMLCYAMLNPLVPRGVLD